jgi:hypothetical protein
MAVRRSSSDAEGGDCVTCSLTSYLAPSVAPPIEIPGNLVVAQEPLIDYTEAVWNSAFPLRPAREPTEPF